MNKRILPLVIVMVLCVLTISCNAESTAATVDATYDTLYNNVIQCIDSGEGLYLQAQYATVWKADEQAAGFMFTGADWDIYGLADMSTGVILKVFCRLPYTNQGLLMACAVNYSVSGEADADTFVEKYMTDEMLLNAKEFPDYVCTLNAGTEDAVIFEWTRNKACELKNADNASDMAYLIEYMQK